MGALVVVGLAACRSGTPASPGTAAEKQPKLVAGPRAATAAAPVAAASCPASAEPAAAARSPRPLRRCFPDYPAWVDSPVALLLDQAATYLEQSEYEGVLACAEEAARQAPRSVEAHHDRAIALIRLDRVDEARDALALALAIAPQDPETLELAADFFINHLPPSAERANIGLEYALRGSRQRNRTDRTRAGHLSLLEGQALIDLGRSGDALGPIDRAIKLLPGEAAARYERGVALFELCRFAEAKLAFERVLEIDPGHAHALHHLGLILEREGDDAAAASRFAEASRRDSKSFPPMPAVSQPDFADRVRRAVARLPDDVRADLASIHVGTEELPATEDLVAELPPLSPSILGLFRGLPLGRDDVREPSVSSGRGGRSVKSRTAPGASPSGNPAHYVAPERAILLYRRNLLRSVSSLEELDRAIERTLLHEVGHLRGEDDGSLRDRGLE